MCICVQVNKEEPSLAEDKEVRMNRSGTDIRSRVSILSAIVIAAFCSTTVIAQDQVKLVSAKPTVFFVRKKLRQWMTDWSDRNDNYPTQPRGDSIQVTRRLWARYSKQLGAQAIKAGD